jgi:hypothetical protein
MQSSIPLEDQDSLCCDEPQLVYLGRTGRTEWLLCENCGCKVSAHDVPAHLFDQALNG